MTAWVTEASYGGVATSELAVLDPGDLARRARWAAVLERARDESPAGAAPPIARGPRHGVVGLGQARPVATRLASATERRLVPANSLAEIARWLTACHELDSLTVVGERHDLRAQALGTLATAAHAADVELGIMTGADLAATSYLAAKALAHRVPAKLRSLEVDAVYGRVDEATVGRLVDEPHDLVVLAAHGEGAHVNLRHAVLCGLLGPEEVDAAGRSVGGCQAERCKRAAPGVRTVPIRDARIDLLVLLSCNGLALAGELFDSSCSVAVALGEGAVVALLTAFRTVKLDPALGPVIHQWLRDGASLGWVAYLLNDLLIRSGAPASFMVLGCPRTLAAPAAATPAWRFEPASHEPSAVWRAVAADGGPAQLWVGTRRVVTTGAALLDATAEVEALRARLRRAHAAVERATTVERALRSMFAGDVSSSRELRSLLFELGARRGAVDRAAWEGLRQLADAARSGRWSPAAEEHAQACEQGMRAWDEALAELVMAGHTQYALPDALHLDYEVASVEQGLACERCGSATWVTRLRAYAGAVAERLLVDCPVCGPIAEHPVHQHALVLRPRTPCIAGAPLAVDVEWAEPVYGGDACVLVELRDKASGRVVSATRHIVPEPLRRLSWSADVPADMGADVHTLRVVLLAGMEQAFARLRLPLAGRAAAPI